MRKIKIVSKKYNGTLRDVYESYLYAEDDTMLVTVSPPGTPYYYHKKQAWFTSEDGLLELYFKNKWYNIWHIGEQNSGINRIYANIALPATFQDDVLTWVDLDLDLRIHVDDRLELLDEDEFVENSALWAYPPVVVEQARAAVAELVQCYAHHAFPLNHAVQVALYATIKARLPSA
ncbi:MAG: DUF402 domain-containing protein [Caldilineaceae bacterium]|nr:DUF402 domain-containing protein [Caldilineaceae bacterium]